MYYNNNNFNSINTQFFINWRAMVVLLSTDDNFKLKLIANAFRPTNQ